jgi:hypothetical protein
MNYIYLERKFGSILQCMYCPTFPIKGSNTVLKTRSKHLRTLNTQHIEILFYLFILHICNFSIIAQWRI